MNKNTTVGFLLIFFVVFIFAYFTNSNRKQLEIYKKQNFTNNKLYTNNIHLPEESTLLLDKETKQTLHSTLTKKNQLKSLYENFYSATQGEEQYITMQNNLLKINLNTKGGYISSVNLKKYTQYNQNPLYLFAKDESVFKFIFITKNNRVLNSIDFYFKVITKTNLQTVLRLNAGKDKWIDLIYTLQPNSYLVDLKLLNHNVESELSPCMRTLNIQWKQKIRQQEQGKKFEERYARLTYKFSSNEVEQLRENRDDFKTISNKLKWIGYKDQYFSSVLISENYFESTTLESKYISNKKYIKIYNTLTSLPYNITNSKPTLLHFYFGPNDYSLLKHYDKTKLNKQNLELEKLVPLGWSLFRTINKHIIIPIFNWLIHKGISLGLSIFLLTLVIKLALFPLTYQSFISSAKIRIIKPQITAITSKYPGNDNALIRQKKTINLYRQVGINPMSGCLPTLLQIPFSISLFMFFPSAIELRQKHFLWSNDLSTYDSIIHWNTTIPYISFFLENHISLFCLLMSLVTIINSKFTTDQQSTSQEQVHGMKIMMYIMPIIMFFFLNSYPAGLNYYYLISTLISILQSITFRLLLNEEKLLIKLETYKRKIKSTNKKSNFINRLEKMQKRHQFFLNERKKNK